MLGNDLAISGKSVPVTEDFSKVRESSLHKYLKSFISNSLLGYQVIFLFRTLFTTCLNSGSLHRM